MRPWLTPYVRSREWDAVSLSLGAESCFTFGFYSGTRGFLRISRCPYPGPYGINLPVACIRLDLAPCLRVKAESADALAMW